MRKISQIIFGVILFQSCVNLCLAQGGTDIIYIGFRGLTEDSDMTPVVMSQMEKGFHMERFFYAKPSTTINFDEIYELFKTDLFTQVYYEVTIYHDPYYLKITPEKELDLNALPTEYVETIDNAAGEMADLMRQTALLAPDAQKIVLAMGMGCEPLLKMMEKSAPKFDKVTLYTPSSICLEPERIIGLIKTQHYSKDDFFLLLRDNGIHAEAFTKLLEENPDSFSLSFVTPIN